MALDYDRLGKLPALAGFTPGEMDNLFAVARRQAPEAGECVLRTGDAADSFFLVVKGQFDVYIRRAGEVVHVASVGAGQLIGEMAWIYKERRRKADVVAAEAGNLLRFDYAAVDALEGVQPDLVKKFKANLSRIAASRSLQNMPRKAPAGPGAQAAAAPPAAQAPAKSGGGLRLPPPVTRTGGLSAASAGAAQADTPGSEPAGRIGAYGSTGLGASDARSVQGGDAWPSQDGDSWPSQGGDAWPTAGGDTWPSAAPAPMPAPPPPTPRKAGPPAAAKPSGDALSGRDAMRQSPLFAGLDDEELAEVEAIASPFMTPPEEVLVQIGEPADSFYLLLDGQVEVHVAKGGQTYPLARLGPGQVIGEMALVFGQPARTASVVALTTCFFLVFDFAAYRHLAESDPTVGRKLKANLGRIAAARSWTMQASASK